MYSRSGWKDGLKAAVIRFLGSNCDLDTLQVLNRIDDVQADLIWHQESNLDEFDLVVLPGGFSYGDYLRAGAIAAHSPIISEIKRVAEEGKPVLGICNGFQILSEAGLLPGTLLRNSGLMFVCKWVRLRVENNHTAFSILTPRNSFLRMPVAHNEGRFFIPRKQLKELQETDRVVYRYVDESGQPEADASPNGALDNIAGVCNEEGNVVGLMPHPERASEQLLSPYCSNDGLLIFKSAVEYISRRT